MIGVCVCVCEETYSLSDNSSKHDGMDQLLVGEDEVLGLKRSGSSIKKKK